MNRLLIALVLVGFLALELVFPGKPDAGPASMGREALAAAADAPSAGSRQAEHTNLIERVVDLARKLL